MRVRAALAAALLLAGCAAPSVRAPAPAVAAAPADLYGRLFTEVQGRRIFPDGKTFVDATPRRPVAEIMAAFEAREFRDDAALRAFVLANFDVPATPATAANDTARPPLAEHIRRLWPQLTRPPVKAEPGSSALPLPRPFVVPGGRFREIYYWDSYFTMLGLKADGRDDLVEGMIDNFVALVERHGHVPNGARTYYLSRSQPPFLFLMMGLSRATDPAVKARRLAALWREHAFWTGPERTIALAGVPLQHWWDARTTPRDESWREDVETAKASGRPAATVYRHLRAGAESGWDYSSRWLADGRTLATIDTAHIVPVDLNSLLWGMERAIAAGCREAGDGPCARDFEDKAGRRRAAIERWLWSEAEGRYGDWDTRVGTLRPGLTAATAYPLFVGLAAPERAARVAGTMSRDLLAPNGLRTTTVEIGQQWDKPNGWAPLQWIAADGLRRYGRDDLARQIASRFVATAEREYRASGRLLEKYDVEKSLPGSGGEYPTQDGFGWTNGVIRGFQERYGL